MAHHGQSSEWKKLKLDVLTLEDASKTLTTQSNTLVPGPPTSSSLQSRWRPSNGDTMRPGSQASSDNEMTTTTNQSSGMATTSTIQSNPEKFLAQRRRSITFDPTVTLDGGERKQIGEALRRDESAIKLRGRSLMQELLESGAAQDRLRPHSESDRSKYSTLTGELVSRRRMDDRSENTYQRGEPRYPLLQASVDELAASSNHNRTGSPNLEPLEKDHLAEVASASPLSTIDSATQFASGEPSLSPSSASSPAIFPLMAESGNLSYPRLKESHRSRSFRAMERSNSGPRLSRRSSGRSVRSGSSVKSPASQFLSQWTAAEESTTGPEPDEDGQPIGDQGQYVIGRQIGYGGFSIVKEAFTIEGGKQVMRAVKIVRKNVPGREDDENERLQFEFDREVSIWRHLRHEHILPLIEKFETSFATFCIMQMNHGGTLFDLVKHCRRRALSNSSTASNEQLDSGGLLGVPNGLIRRYLRQLSSAIRYLHQDMHLVHRDIKLENCLISKIDSFGHESEEGNVLLCDFGMADYVNPDDREVTLSEPIFDGNWDLEGHTHNIGPGITSTNVAGSLEYASPELIKASRPLLAPSVDMWAFGVTAYALFTTKLPFSHPFTPRLSMLILRGEWDASVLSNALGNASRADQDRRIEGAEELIRGCLNMAARSRWTITQVLDCNFLRAP